MTDVHAIVRAYGAAWLEANEAERRRLLEVSWGEDGVYRTRLRVCWVGKR